MEHYYILLQTKPYAFLLERKMKEAGVSCDISYVPRGLSTDLCNVSVKLPESEIQKAMEIIKLSRLPEYKIFKEIVDSSGYTYEPVDL